MSCFQLHVVRNKPKSEEAHWLVCVCVKERGVGRNVLILLLFSEEICTLVIAEVFSEDSGSFTCTASNKYGTVSNSAYLMVKGKRLF